MNWNRYVKGYKQAHIHKTRKWRLVGFNTKNRTYAYLYQYLRQISHLPFKEVLEKVKAKFPRTSYDTIKKIYHSLRAISNGYGHYVPSNLPKYPPRWDTTQENSYLNKESRIREKNRLQVKNLRKFFQ